MQPYTTLLFDDASGFITTLPDSDKSKLLASIKIMETDMGVVSIKPLRGPIKELRVRKYRLLFFTKDNVIYFTHGFIKKSQKTPPYEIDRAEGIFKRMG